jgi:hypothetical protein
MTLESSIMPPASAIAFGQLREALSSAFIAFCCKFGIPTPAMCTSGTTAYCVVISR